MNIKKIFRQKKTYPIGDIEVLERFKLEINQFVLYFCEYIWQKKQLKIELNIETKGNTLKIYATSFGNKSLRKQIITEFKEYLMLIELENDFSFSYLANKSKLDDEIVISTDKIQSQIDHIQHRIRIDKVLYPENEKTDYFKFVSVIEKWKKKSFLAKIPFYPGGIWMKRLGHLAVIFLIGANLFLDNVQDEYLRKIEASSDKISNLTKSIGLNKTKISELSINAINLPSEFRKLKIEEVNQEYWSTYFYDIIAGLGDLPDSDKINKLIRELNSYKETFVKGVDEFSSFITSAKKEYEKVSSEINSINIKAGRINESANQINTKTDEISFVLKKVIQFLDWTSFFMWFPIGISIIWLLHDLKKGNAKTFVLLVLIVSIPFNFSVYQKLNLEFGNIENQIKNYVKK